LFESRMKDDTSLIWLNFNYGPSAIVTKVTIWPDS
jgi:hypothetical protein